MVDAQNTLVSSGRLIKYFDERVKIRYQGLTQLCAPSLVALQILADVSLARVEYRLSATWGGSYVNGF